MPDLYLNNLRLLVIQVGMQINATEHKVAKDELNGGYKFKDGQSLLILDAVWDNIFPLYMKELIKNEIIKK